MASQPPSLPPRSTHPYVQAFRPSQDKLLGADPRTSSTQSLVPSVDELETSRRRLLIVYIHGFYGNDQSFRSFPAHIHAFLRAYLADSHVIHSKIYPRYKTYRSVDIARDNFSAWLDPHESPTTDVILVGHSMGGLLAADVVLMPNHDASRQQRFKHRILGTISLDSPFLGLHPGIIASGISSLFKPAPKPPDESQTPTGTASPVTSPPASLNAGPSADSASQSSFFSPSLLSVSSLESGAPDPHFNPPYVNDQPFKEKPFLRRLGNFVTKHKDKGLVKAFRHHVISHLEYGGILADYKSLNSRYHRIRELEDVDEFKALSEGHPPGAYAQVRFVNYYTISTGRPPAETTEPTSSTTDQPPMLSESGVEVSGSDQAGAAGNASQDNRSDDHVEDSEDDGSSTLSLEHLDPRPLSELAPEPIDSPRTSEAADGLQLLSVESIDSGQQPQPSATLDGAEKEGSQAPSGEGTEKASLDQDTSSNLNLPAIQPVPSPPAPFDPSAFTDEGIKKQAEKEHRRQQKTYDQAVKNNLKALKEREKMLDKRRKQAQKEIERLEKEQTRREKEDEKRRAKQQAGSEAAASSSQSIGNVGLPEDNDTTPAEQAPEELARISEGAQHDEAGNPEKPKKLRKFCTTPNEKSGKDRTWVDIYMDGVDEIGAHCGLFFPGPHYEILIGDVGSRIVGWVHDDLSKRAVMEFQP